MQSLARAVRLDRETRAVLRALGTRSRAIVAASLVAPATAVLAGVTLAAMLAVAASPLMPIGPVRRVDVARRFHVDAGLIALGAAAVALLLLSFLVVLGWSERPHRVRARGAVGRPPRIVDAMSSAGMSPPAVTGVRFALEPSDAVTAAPSRSVIAGAAIAIAALVGATTFGASLRALVDRPHLYGWDWDATIIAGDGFSNMPLADAAEILGRDPDVAEWSGAHFGFDAINGHDTPVLGMTTESRVVPTIVDGRFLRGPDEIVLGQETARLAHADIGDRILVGGSANPRRATVVGTAVLPTIGMIHVAHTSLGVGAIVEQSRLPGVDRVSLVLALVASVRRHRRDLSILKALGFTPRQLGATVSWHATSVVLLGAAIGVPLGALLGRLLWSQFARRLDVVVHPHLPVLLFLGIAFGAIVVGNAVAVMPS